MKEEQGKKTSRVPAGKKDDKVIPAKPTVKEATDLSDEDLDKVAGGQVKQLLNISDEARTKVGGGTPFVPGGPVDNKR